MTPAGQILAEATQRSGWASRPLAVDRARVFASHYRAYPVELIATFNPGLVTCDKREKVGDVLPRPDVQIFDFLPVVDGPVVGLFNRAGYAAKGNVNDARPVGDLMDPLCERNLISSDTGLLTFVSGARKSPCRLVIRDTTIDGIVTISDLQKLPVRPSLFFLITYVELLIADTLRAAGCTEKERWFHVLSRRRQKKIERKWETLRAGDMDIDKLTASDFADKRDALVKLIELPVSNSRTRRELKRVEKLRDSVAHAGDYATTRDAALNTIDAVRLAESWIERLESVLADIEERRTVA